MDETTASTMEATEIPVPDTTEAPSEPAAAPAETEVAATEIIEVPGETAGETVDYEAYVLQIAENTAMTAEASGYIAGFCLTFAVVLLCYFVYKFLRIFF